MKILLTLSICVNLYASNEITPLSTTFNNTIAQNYSQSRDASLKSNRGKTKQSKNNMTTNTFLTLLILAVMMSNIRKKTASPRGLTLTANEQDVVRNGSTMNISDSKISIVEEPAHNTTAESTSVDITSCNPNVESNTCNAFPDWLLLIHDTKTLSNMPVIDWNAPVSYDYTPEQIANFIALYAPVDPNATINSGGTHTDSSQVSEDIQRD